MKRKYFVLDTMNPTTELYYTVVCPVTIEYDNVIKKLENWAGSYKIIAAMLCDTKKRAFEICDAWRQGHKDNGNADKYGSFIRIEDNEIY